MALMWQSSISKLWTNGAVIEVLVRVSVTVWGPCIGPNQRYLSPKGYTDQVLKFIFPPKHFGGSIAPSKVSLSPPREGGDRDTLEGAMLPPKCFGGKMNLRT